MTVGINVSNLAYYGNSRSYANLVAPGAWRSNQGETVNASQIDADGGIKYLNPGERAIIYIPAPEGPYTTKDVRCTWEGSGKVGADSDSALKMKPHGAGRGSNYIDLTSTWKIEDNGNVSFGYVYIEETNPADPIRNIDCREKDMDKSLLWSPQFTNSLKGFPVLRFLDWSEGNSVKGGDWNRFASPTSQFVTTIEGVRPQDMIALANTMDADPWIPLAYNGDENYHRQYAQLVRDTLKPGRKVYVELANEVWNYMFAATSQARDEGVAAKLSADPHQAMLHRYGQKSAWAMKIWSEVFAGQMHRLVRVANVQNSGNWSVHQVLGFQDTHKVIDAVAIAPYMQLKTEGLTLDQVFAGLDGSIAEALDWAIKTKAGAVAFNKPMIAYEAGQHIVTNDIAFARQIQRDPRMEGVYKKYMDAWADQIGGLMVMFSHTSAISQYGSWGLREYASQSPSEAPKWRAVQSYLKK